MSDMITLAATARSKDMRANALRRSGQVPAVVYGNEQQEHLQLEEVALKKAYTKAGESTLVELDLGSKKLPVLFHDVDYDPVSDRMIHVDFYAVNMKKEVEAEVHIRFEGESPAVKEGAVLVSALHVVTVKALPANLPHDLVLDISTLSEMGGTLTVANLLIPNGVTIVDAPESVIVVAQEPRAEEVVEAPVAAVEGAVAADGTAVPAAEGAAAPAAAEGKKEKE